METVERDWNWWAYHYRVVHRSQIPGISRWDDDLVDMIVEWRATFDATGLCLTHALADTKLPPTPYDRDHYGNLVIVGRLPAPLPLGGEAG